MNIDNTSTYNFTLTLTNSMGEKQSISSTPVDITISSPSTATNGDNEIIDNGINNTNNNNTGLFGDRRRLMTVGLIVIALLVFMLIGQIIARNRRGY